MHIVPIQCKIKIRSIFGDLEQPVASMPQPAAKNGFRIRIQREISFLHHLLDSPYRQL